MSLCHDIQRRLYHETVSASELVMPNYSPRKWFECDFFRVTKAGYFYEYEIKVSVSDFRADRRKHDYDWKANASVPKHLRLATRDEKGPSRFFFVMPAEVAEKVRAEIPDWAGLIEFGRYLRCTKQAPILHKARISRAIIRQAKSSAVYRYWDFYSRSPEIARIKQLEGRLPAEPTEQEEQRQEAE